MNISLLKQRSDLKRYLNKSSISLTESEQLAILRKIEYFNQILREENLQRGQNV